MSVPPIEVGVASIWGSMATFFLADTMINFVREFSSLDLVVPSARGGVPFE